MNGLPVLIELQARILAQLSERVDVPGGLVYSAATTVRPGPLYIMGLNPGGDPAKETHTIRDSIKQLSTQVGNDYLDAWGKFGAGEAPLQRRIKYLVEDVLGQTLEGTFATNLIFRKTRSAASLDLWAEGRACWPVHELFLEIVRPSVILAFGNAGVSPYRFLLQHARVTATVIGDESTAPSQHGSWRLRSFRMSLAGRSTRVVGFPHLSRYDPTRKPEVALWLREMAGLQG